MHFTLICQRLLGAISICTTQGPQYVCCTNFSIICLNNTMQWYTGQNLMGVGFIGLVICISIYPLSMPLYQIPCKIKEDIHIPTKLAEAQNIFYVVCTSNKEAHW
ncbi:unnamed protein product [Sphagnum jensenii]|uniref:Uncharacterized protein n=1 Tax=Sphagnum jensenii TaxID=128206 RepID=A0ABP0XFB3_9BRYO